MTGQNKIRGAAASSAALTARGARGVGFLPQTLVALSVVFIVAAGGCGNYSNEDLEFMNAIPQRDDVTIEVPRQASLTAAGVGAAEGWKTTLKVTRDLNGVADAFLSLIEKVRSYYPTAREANTRIWGPFPADKNPGWQFEFRMWKNVSMPTPHFDYELVMIPPPGIVLLGGGPVTRIIAGSFDAAGGVRVGMGTLIVTLAEARAAGIVFPGLDTLQTLTIEYSTRDWPRWVKMTIENVPATDTSVAVTASYDYERAENGDGAMSFSVPGNMIGAEGSAFETLLFETRWLGTGQGRADISVTGGDAPPTANSLECWGEDFRQTYWLRSWLPVGTDNPTGDPGSCIARL